MQRILSPNNARLLLACVVVLQALLLGFTATQLSPTPDEFPQLVAGLSYLRSGQYDLYNVNPPLIKVFAALPAVLDGYRVPAIEFGLRRPEFVSGRLFWELHGVAAERHLILARWTCIAFNLLGTLAVFRLGQQLFSHRIGLAALTPLCRTSSSMLYAGACDEALPTAHRRGAKPSPAALG